MPVRLIHRKIRGILTSKSTLFVYVRVNVGHACSAHADVLVMLV
jgi:hypothetical protein